MGASSWISIPPYLLPSHQFPRQEQRRSLSWIFSPWAYFRALEDYSTFSFFWGQRESCPGKTPYRALQPSQQKSGMRLQSPAQQWQEGNLVHTPGAELPRIAASISQQHQQVWCADIPQKARLLPRDRALSRARSVFHSQGARNAFPPLVIHVAPSILHRS